LRAVLGKGGMGIVYEAEHVALKRKVALKVILAGGHADDEQLARFRREAEAVARIQHPNIVQIYDVGERDGLPYFAMEYVPGGGLDRKLAGNPQPPREAAALVQTLARAMQAAHDRGVVHRDLKPANVLLGLSDSGSQSGDSQPSLGVPKVADFGLAKRLDEATLHTASGAVLGTPSYMAPEQALGDSRRVGAAADVYALGAILYECLTGRPPFRAETRLETLRQVLNEEPVPPSWLNPGAARDLETICLKCLHKTPGRRYASAAALADDLQRFLAGESIVARRPSVWERALKGVRRRPAATALVGLLLGVVGYLVAAALRLEREHMEVRYRVSSTLEQAGQLQQQAQFAEARALLERAAGWLGESGPADLRDRVEALRQDLELMARLDAIRLRKAMMVRGNFDFASADRAYAAIFQKVGLARPDDEAAAVAERIRRSAVRGPLVAALDDWAGAIGDRQRRAWVLEVARRADPHPWCDRFRSPMVWEDATALQQLVAEAPIAELSPQLLAVVGIRLMALGGDPEAFLTAAVEQYPGDFWLNFILGTALTQRRPEEAVGYYRAALAVRPGTAVVYNNLAVALQARDRHDEAIAACRKAIRLDPAYPRVYYSLSVALQARGRWDEAIAACCKAIELDPRYALAHTTCGVALRVQGRLDEAIAAHCKAIELDPSLYEAWHNLRVALRARGALPDPGLRTVGLLGAPLGQGPLLASSSLFSGRPARAEGVDPAARLLGLLASPLGDGPLVAAWTLLPRQPSPRPAASTPAGQPARPRRVFRVPRPVYIPRLPQGTDPGADVVVPPPVQPPPAFQPPTPFQRPLASPRPAERPRVRIYYDNSAPKARPAQRPVAPAGRRPSSSLSSPRTAAARRPLAAGSGKSEDVVSGRAPVHITVIVPATAEVWFNGDRTAQKGQRREFVTPPLQAGRTFSYEIRARWPRNDTIFLRAQAMHFQAGDRVLVDFTTPRDGPEGDGVRSGEGDERRPTRGGRPSGGSR
jgi:serine/threonine-protein kinase